MTRYRGGRPYREWINAKRERNEPADARIYSVAALFSLLMQGVNLDKHCADFQRQIAPPEPAPAPVK
jgi:phage terminase large subunit GpA-like protein